MARAFTSKAFLLQPWLAGGTSEGKDGIVVPFSGCMALGFLGARLHVAVVALGGGTLFVGLSEFATMYGLNVRFALLGPQQANPRSA